MIAQLAPARARAALLYGTLAYAITWLAVLPLAARGLGWWSGTVPEAWHAIGALGPVGGAWLAARICRGDEGVRSWLQTLTRFRVRTRWWGIAVGSPLALFGIAVISAGLVTGEWPGTVSPGGASLGLPTWWAGMLLVSLAYGLGEEPGWRGFLLPELLRRHSARVATLWVAVVWAAWHAPFFAYRYELSGPATVVGFFIAMLAGAAWLTFLYLGSGGSVPVVAVWHVLWNVVNLVGAEMSELVVVVLNASIMMLGFGTFLALRGKRPSEEPESDWASSVPSTSHDPYRTTRPTRTRSK